MNSEERETKWRRLLEMTEHPEQYSYEEWRQVTDDEETNHMYHIMLEAARAYDATQQLPDETEVEEAWRQWQMRRPVEVNSHRRWRYAAVFAGFLLSGIALAALYPRWKQTFWHADKESGQQRIEKIEVTKAQKAVSMQNDVKMVPQMVSFRSESLERVVDSIASYYGCDYVFQSDRSKSMRLHLRWDQSEPVDSIVRRINRFEKINISLSSQTITVQ